MADPAVEIWNKETGITDLIGNPDDSSASEVPGIKAIWADQKKRQDGTAQLSEFIEKLSREWAIETGIIENLYEINRSVTQTLIEQGFRAELLNHGDTNKPRESVLQLLRDQKNALDGVFDFVKGQRKLSTSYIKELHAALLRSQDATEGIDTQGHMKDIPLIKGDWKKQPNYPIRDGIAYTYCPPEHVAAEMDRLVSTHLEHAERKVSGEVQAAWLHHRFTQIHPFQDGNGRVARAIASLVLVKDGLFPLVVTRDDKPTYLKSLEAADEGDLKQLITFIVKRQITQFRKATAITEALLADADVQDALDSLNKEAEKVAAEKLTELRGVIPLAKSIENDLEQRIRSIQPDIFRALKRVAAEGGAAHSKRSSTATDHYFRAQIIDNAKNHFHYFADMSEYRSWVALNMFWSRRAKLTFTIHGIGRPFNGSLICAPFLEFRDTDEEKHVRSTLLPIAEEGFVFFYNEKEEQLLSRFRLWRENVLKIALKELQKNL